jgi:hypothetical protein
MQIKTKLVLCLRFLKILQMKESILCKQTDYFLFKKRIEINIYRGIHVLKTAHRLFVKQNIPARSSSSISRVSNKFIRSCAYIDKVLLIEK